MADEFEKPDTSHLKLKAKEIVLTEPVSRAGDPGAISVQSIHRQNLDAEARRKLGGKPPPPSEPVVVPAGFKLTEVAAVSPPAPAHDPEAIKVPEILRENAAVDHASGWSGYKEPPRRMPRRKRELLLLLAVDLVIAGVILVTRSLVVTVIGLGVIAVVTSTSLWIILFMTDDY